MLDVQHHTAFDTSGTAFPPWSSATESRAGTPLDALDSGAHRITAKRGHEIYAEGDAAESCYKLVSGCVRLVKLMSDGERQICEFLVPGDVFGLEVLGTHYFSAEAVTDATVVRYARNHAERLIAYDPAAAQHIRKLTSASLQGAYERMVLLCHKSAQGRIAWFLLDMASRAKPSADNCIDLPMTRADIAAYLGMVIETVSRTITQLKRDGVISLKTVNRIALLDRSALEDMAGLH